MRDLVYSFLSVLIRRLGGYLCECEATVSGSGQEFEGADRGAVRHVIPAAARPLDLSDAHPLPPALDLLAWPKPRVGRRTQEGGAAFVQMLFPALLAISSSICFMSFWNLRAVVLQHVTISCSWDTMQS